MARDRNERKHRKTAANPEAVAMMAGANFDTVPPLAVAMGYLEMTSDHNGETESGEVVLSGTTVKYKGHVPGGMVRVELPSGTVVVMHPHCFPTLR